ncbi:DUF4142 domain-containing protein [Solirubrum puertoriconensis]|uniref:DUF4142 domain-containing protein n=1 Tax=Solirubrum puertoriconensis TaxID=1751427 RepID=A0A9X0L330_SOLP1|nr:DUF4142 domain-containing protein [Solirubrum puertoriconensis]KUG06112.1 hypothetical protein ASU33_01730 [Solirubrum puertoriconensis]
MHLLNRYLPLCLLGSLLACNSGNRDPVADAKFQNEQRIGNEDVTERQEQDAEFLVEAATNGLLEVELSKLAQSKATRAEVRNLAQQLLRGHSTINTSLRTLAGQKSIVLPESLGGDQQDTYTELAALTGAEFDRRYVEEVADAHNKAEDAFEDMADEAYDGDIRAFAAKYAPVFEEHRKQAEEVEDLLKP